MTFELTHPASASRTDLQWAADVESVALALERLTDVGRVKEIVDKATALERFGRAQRSAAAARHHAAAVLILAKHRLAELLEEMPKAEGARNRGKSGGTKVVPPPTLEKLGIGKAEATRLRQLAKLSKPQLKAYIADVQRRSEKITTTGAIAVATSHSESYDSDEWYTDEKYVEDAREVLGGIDLDPASSDIAQKTVRAKRYYTKATNGLTRRWNGRTWMNPPYSAIIAQFVARLIAAFVAGDVPAAVVLTNASTDTEWWHELARAAGSTCFTKGRLAFLTPGGKRIEGNRVGQTFFCLGDDETQLRFTEKFSAHGLVMRPRALL